MDPAGEAELIGALIDAAARTIEAHEAELTALDQAVGDGDHGTNLARGFRAVRDERARIAGEPLAKALQSAGMTLVMKVGGASGPLYGSLLMGMGKALVDRPLDRATAAAAVEAGVQAVMQRGRSQPGEKTMLDVLAPVAAALRDGPDEGNALAARLRAAADEGLEATRPLRATKGRASYLGERSIGHLDPGARSSALLVHAVCDVLAGRG